MIWAISGGVIALLIGVIVWMLVLRKKKDPGTFAQRMGLVEQGDSMRGQNQGFGISVEKQRRGRSDAGARTMFRITFPQRLGLGVSIAGLQGRPRSHRAIETGDAAFDAAVAVEAQDAAKAQEYLTPTRRGVILQLIESDPRAHVTDEGFQWTTDGIISDFAPLRQVVDDMIDAAIELFPGRSARKVARRAEKMKAR